MITRDSVQRGFWKFILAIFLFPLALLPFPSLFYLLVLFTRNHVIRATKKGKLYRIILGMVVPTFIAGLCCFILFLLLMLIQNGLSTFEILQDNIMIRQILIFESVFILLYFVNCVVLYIHPHKTKLFATIGALIIGITYYLAICCLHYYKRLN